jgi:hypothetical protein
MTLPPAFDEDYMLNRLVLRTANRHIDCEMAAAIRAWEADLKFLRNNF